MEIIQHPNGFVRVVFSGNSKEGWDRLHVWNTPGLMDGADIHQHSYDFTSSIVAGVMEEKLFTYMEDPIGLWDRCTVQGWTDETGYHVNIIDRIPVTPVLTETLIHKAGETYFRSKADFHLVTAMEVPLVTRCVTGRQEDRTHYYFLREQ